ncbi:MAG: helix-turn-helix domain-containing protein [Nitrospira sp. BO4]|jgi:predicted DNA-binding transcriptional regulator AlpA|nr:helix-turn-helix domain-containing protein [Nitrospira sp. BO4]
MASTSPIHSRVPQSIQAESPQLIGPSPLLNATQCAIALGIPKSSLYRMVQEGLPAFRIGQHGRGLRFDLAEVREALRNFKTGEVNP